MPDESALYTSDDGGRRGNAVVLPDGGLTGLDRILKLLADRQRRYSLYYLEDEKTCTLENLARHVAAVELDVSEGDVPSERVDEVEARILHAHLPMMVDADVVEWDDRSRTVRLVDPSPPLAALLRLLRNFERIDR